MQRHDSEELSRTPFLVFVRCEGSTSSLFVDHNTDVADLKAGLATRTGVPAEHQLLTCCGRHLQAGLVASQIQSEGTISLIYRLHGGQQTSNVKVTLQPRIQKDKWSMYWKESMATKTDSCEAVTVEADVNTTVAKLQQQLAESLRWQPVDSLVRLEGFRGPWEFAVCKGRSVNPAVSLKANGITTDATITVVRQVLIPEVWKSITDVQSTAEDSSSEEDTF